MRRWLVFPLLALLSLIGLASPVEAERPPISDPQAPVRVFPTVTYLGTVSDAAAVISGNGRWVAYTKEDKTLALWDAATNNFSSFAAEGFPAGVSDDGQWILYRGVLNRTSTVFELNSSTGASSRLSGLETFAVSPAMSSDGQVRAWYESAIKRTVLMRRGSSRRELFDAPGKLSQSGLVFASETETLTIASGETRTLSTDRDDMYSESASDGETRLMLEDSQGGYYTSMAVVDADYQTIWRQEIDNGWCCLTYNRAAMLSGDGSTVISRLFEREGNHNIGLPFRIDALGVQEIVIPQAPDRDAKAQDISSDGTAAVFAFWIDDHLHLVHLDFTNAPTIPNVPAGAMSAPQLSDQVRRLFAAYFGRPADSDGLAYWMAQRAGGRSLASVSEFFASSPEFVAQNGTLSNSQFVNLVYQNVLGRPADNAGLSYWIEKLNTGLPRGALMVGFSESPEYIQQTQTSRPIPAPAGEIQRLFSAYFNRPADDGGLEFWMQQRSTGRTLESISEYFSTSSEFNSSYGQLSDAQFVDLVYDNVLGRPPEPSGRNYWIGQLSAGTSRGELMTGFSESAENIIRSQTLPLG